MNNINENALNNMCRKCSNYEQCRGTGCYDKNILKILVNKENEKKPVMNKCPNCETLLEEGVNYCNECGQKIDWSDDE